LVKNETKQLHVPFGLKRDLELRFIRLNGPWTLGQNTVHSHYSGLRRKIYAHRLKPCDDERSHFGAGPWHSACASH
jgi:hypothetical protein